MRILVSLLTFLALAAAAAAQRATASPQVERRQTHLVVQTEDHRTLAFVSIQYGQAAWRPEYSKELESPSGSNYTQLGKGFWTSLDTIAAIEIGGVKLEAGCYFLGLRVEAGGGVHLLVFDAVQAMKDGMLPGSTPLYAGEKKPIATAKLELAREDEKQVAPVLVLELSPDEKDARRALLAIRWGNAVASAPLVLHPVGEKDAVRGQQESVEKK